METKKNEEVGNEYIYSRKFLTRDTHKKAGEEETVRRRRRRNRKKDKEESNF